MQGLRDPIRAYLRRLGEVPLHLRALLVPAILLIVSFFLPGMSLVLFTREKLRLSLSSILTSGAMRLTIHEAPFTLSFGDATPFLVLALLIPIVIAALVLLYPVITARVPGRAISAVTLILFVVGLFTRLLALSRLVPASFLTQAGLSSGDLHFAATAIENVAILLAIIGAILAFFGTLGIVVRVKMLSYPYFLWLIVFTILPLLLIFFAAFFEKNPDGSLSFTIDGFRQLLVDRVVDTDFYGIPLKLQEYFSVFLHSLDYAVSTTIGCLLIAYPLAYVLAARTRRLHSDSSLMLMFFVLPMWINTMLRTYAWRAFFGQTGVLNNLLLSLHVISDPILFLKLDLLSDFIIKLVLVNDFLPFMLLPIYSVLVKLDDNVKQAAHDLGANARQTFFRVVLPLSMPGVISGIQMVFMPSLTFYMIPDIISEGSVTTIGSTVQAFILSESATQQLAGNVLSLLLLIFVLITMGILRNSDRESGGGGMIL